MKKLDISYLGTFLLSCIFNGSVYPAEPKLEGFPWPDPANGTILEAPETAGKIQLDGRLEEKTWASAGMVRDFYRAADAGRSPGLHQSYIVL